MPLYELLDVARARLKNPCKQRRTKSHALIGIRAWQVEAANKYATDVLELEEQVAEFDPQAGGREGEDGTAAGENEDA